MELLGNGLNNNSHMYFYTPSQTAKKLLYYPIAVGEFQCNSDYNVSRKKYDSFLAVYVLTGSITMIQDEIQLTAKSSELLLIDCYKEHRYFTSSSAHTLWVHFDGNNSREWFAEITSQKTQKIKCTRQTSECIFDIINQVRNNQSEYAISNSIYSLLCILAKNDDIKQDIDKSARIESAKEFIKSNYDRHLTLHEIAAAAHMSVSYFSRIFKESAGFSPYDYLLAIRLDKAMELLQKTESSIEIIAYKTGFNSASNFIYFFKKKTGISPLKFRRLKF
ncbi:MAG: AraC family transcriptional regulator [Faecalibacterium sp.]|nr:AraC family transcriptional regulator [Ruminococcus sp.]MCM1392747.1 AraC family transcriptional regulator [Ruminococcus sp.]MCM1486297.1 AraC family transcriptional regulator [Faecalibacterium sp.]